MDTAPMARRPPRRTTARAPTGGTAAAEEEADEAMKELVEFLCRELVDDPDAVASPSPTTIGARPFTVQVAPGELGRVIGRGGRTAKAIRTVVRAAAARQQMSAARVDFED